MTVLRRKAPGLTLEQAMKRLTFDPETGHFTSLRTGKRAGTLRKDGYRQIGVGGRLYLEQNLAWWFHAGEWMPDGLSVDHINRDRADNRIKNLRLLTPTGQVHNRDYKGYWLNKKRGVYDVGLKRKGVFIWGGSFRTEEEAAAKAAEMRFE